MVLVLVLTVVSLYDISNLDSLDDAVKLDGIIVVVDVVVNVLLLPWLLLPWLLP